MANLIIKPTSGGSLILQDEGGTAAHTIDASGNSTLAGNTTVSGNLVVSGQMPSGTIAGWTETTTTHSATQGANTSYTDVTGSSISYTPPSGASKVVYQYSTVVTNSHNNALWYFTLVHDGSDVANTNHAFYVKLDDGDAGLGYKTWNFVLPAWTGAKVTKLQYRMHSGTYTGRLHFSSYSAAGSATDVYCKSYLIVYSVM